MNIYQFYTDPESLDHYEERLTRVPKLAHEHAKRLGRRFPDGEAAIAKDPAYAFLYAYSIINGRFPEGEAAIAKDAMYAYEYATDVIKERFPKGEAAIDKNEWIADLYARFLIRQKRFMT
jgi:hypothetical protein